MLLTAKRKTVSTPLTFGELEVGDKFICFPMDGDDHGHGGFRGTFWVYKKTPGKKEGKFGLEVNARRTVDKVTGSFPDNMKIIRVE